MNKTINLLVKPKETNQRVDTFINNREKLLKVMIKELKELKKKF